MYICLILDYYSPRSGGDRGTSTRTSLALKVFGYDDETFRSIHAIFKFHF